MQDYTLEKNLTGVYDLVIQDGKIKETSGLDSAILMSLFTEKRATEDQIKEPSQRRGWIGNEINENVEYEIGSYLWLLDQSRINQETANFGESYILDSFQWMVDDGLASSISVDSELLSDKIVFDLTFRRSDGSELSFVFDLWENTLLLKC